MALTKTNIGTDENGRPRFHYHQDDPDAHVVFVGQGISGQVTVADGTTYDVTEDFIEVASADHAGEVAHAIGVRHEAEGHPGHTDGQPFVHHCTDHCGGLQRKARRRG